MTPNHQINKQGKGSRSHSPEKNDQKQPPKKNLQVDEVEILRSGSEKKKSVRSSRCNDAIDALNVSKGKRKIKKGNFIPAFEYSSKSLIKDGKADYLKTSLYSTDSAKPQTSAAGFGKTKQKTIHWSSKCAARLKIVEKLKDPTDKIHLLTPE